MKSAVHGKRWAQEYRDLGTGPLTTEPYISERYFALERDRVFRRSWLYVGRVEEISQPGDYFVRDIAMCRVSVLIMRGSDSVVRGFHNVCSHRGNTLVQDERGSCPGRVFCQFHSWVYKDTGELLHVPDEENFHDLDKSEHGLTPVNTDIWEGFIFVHLDPEPAWTLRDYLDDVADRLDGCPFHEMELFQVYRVEERANWKIGLDAQNELYHLPFQHRRTLGDVFATNDVSGSRFKDVRLYRRHSAWEGEYRRFQSLTPLKIALFVNRDDTPAFDVPQVPDGMIHFNLFPNTVLTLFKVGKSTSCITYNFWPVAVDRTVWEIRFHFRPAATIGERIQQEYFKCLIRETLQEDTAAHESVHAGIASRAKPHILLQDDEVPIRHFRKVLDACIGEDQLAGSGSP